MYGVAQSVVGSWDTQDGGNNLYIEYGGYIYE